MVISWQKLTDSAAKLTDLAERMSKPKTELQKMILQELRDSLQKPDEALAEVESKLQYRLKIRNTSGGVLEFANEQMINSLEEKKKNLLRDEKVNWMREMLRNYR